MNQEFIENLTSIVEANLSDENFGPEQLAEKLGISHTTLHRRVKQSTGKTISRFIRDMRLEKACSLLLHEESTISEIAYKVGFSSVTYFNRCFHEKYVCSPGEFKKNEAKRDQEAITSHKKNNQRKIRIGLFTSLLIIIVVFFILNEKYSFFEIKPVVDKSVAVLPVQNLGNSDSEYLADGIGESIKDQLSKIQDLRVIDVSAFREYIAKNSELEIVKKLNIGSILKMTFLKESEQIVLFVSLINSRDGTLIFSEKYISSLEDIFTMPSKIAQTIAHKLHANISEEEKTRIEKLPTINPIANDFYQRGEDAYNNYDLDKAEDNYRKALNYDSTFAQAYTGLARIAFDKISAEDILNNDNKIDTIFALADKALKFDNTLADAYTIKGYYYSIKDPDKAVAEFEQAIHFDPNNWLAYTGLADYYGTRSDIKSVEYYFEAIKRRQGPEYDQILASLCFKLITSGLNEQAKKYMKIKMEYSEDSVDYYAGLSLIEQFKGNFSEAIKFALSGYKLESTDISINQLLAFNYTLLKDYKNAFYYYKKCIYLSSNTTYINRNTNQKRGYAAFYTTDLGNKDINDFHRIGYVFYIIGDTATANVYFQKQIDACTLDNNNQTARMIYDLAATYSILNQQNKAYEKLRVLRKEPEIPWFIYAYMKIDPFFDNIRNETEFQQILTEIADKANKERDKLKTWLEQQEDS